ncbi:MAG: glycosyltransferase [Ignavibacteriae bacterium]|nr:glycosyltransferase [Ignavibacteriota bacterium]NOG97073.1 glycosyltransferase [Ignavibacteriota bacterium]
MNKLAPVLLFVYNRPDHARITLDALSQNTQADQSELFIFSDGPKKEESGEKINSLREYIRKFKGFKNITIIERDSNYGLARSVITGVSEIFKIYDKVIVVEDDLITSPNFLVYMNCLLDKYHDMLSIYSISGYSFPIKLPPDCDSIYLAKRASSWGWGTWKNRWEDVDWNLLDFSSFIKNKDMINSFNKGGKDLTRMLKKQVNGKIDSWAIRWSYHHFKNNAFCIYPKISKVHNIGQDNSGRHSIKTNKYKAILDTEKKFELPDIDLTPNSLITKELQSFFNYTLFERVSWFIKRKLKF